MVAFLCRQLDGICAGPRDSTSGPSATPTFMIDAILRDLQQPEYLHVLINPLPVYGLAIALFGLIAAMYLGTRGGQVTALVLIFACAASAWPVAHYGEAAEDRVQAMTDDDGQAWLKAHAHRADDLICVFYVLALVSAAAIF